MCSAIRRNAFAAKKRREKQRCRPLFQTPLINSVCVWHTVRTPVRIEFTAVRVMGELLRWGKTPRRDFLPGPQKRKDPRRTVDEEKPNWNESQNHLLVKWSEDLWEICERWTSGCPSPSSQLPLPASLARRWDVSVEGRRSLAERRARGVGFGGQWLHRVRTKGAFTHLQRRWDHKLVDVDECRWGLKDRRTVRGGRGSSRPWCSRRVYVRIALCIPHLNPLWCTSGCLSPGWLG